MNLALGAMGSLLPKLGELLKDEYKMQTSVKRDIQAFSRELGSMRAALHRVAEVPRDQIDEEVKLWAGDVRELSYDMEDVVDSLLVRVKGSGADADMDGFKELVSKMKGLFKKGKARRQIATAIKDIKEQVQDVAARHERYKADGIFANLAAATRITAVDPLLVALYEDKQRLVGIENTRDELIEKLRLTDDDESKQPKIFSIVGFGGLGKTTLAKAIYDKVESEFDCAAFVSVSRSPDIKKVFKDLLFEVDKKKYMDLSGATLNEKQLIAQLRESLKAKRFQHVLFAPHMFPRGAMPMVKELRFGLLVSDILSGGDWDLCLRNLPSLEHVSIKLYGENNKSMYYEAKTVVERARYNHPNRPITDTWDL